MSCENRLKGLRLQKGNATEMFEKSWKVKLSAKSYLLNLAIQEVRVITESRKIGST